MPEESEIEIRPMFEAADFDEEFTPELREEEANLEAALSMKKAAVQSYLFFGGRCDEALSVPTEADADRVFNALASGGKIDMPLVKTFWSPRYGMVTDKFGVGWMVMVPGPDPL